MTQRSLLESSPDYVKVLEAEDGKVRVRHHQNDRPILELNQKAQNNFSRSDLHTKWATPIMRIPYVAYKQLVAENPELISQDQHERTMAWMRIARERPDLRTVPKNYVPSGNRFDLA